MFKKELMKIGLSAAVGLVLGLIAAVNQDAWGYLLLLPVQVIGIVYSYQYLFRAIVGLFEWLANVVGMAIGTMNCLGVLLALILTVALMLLVLQVMWIAGLVLMLLSLFQAFRQDGMILQMPRIPLPWSRRESLPGRTDEDIWGDDDWGQDDDDRNQSGDNWGDDDGSWDDT